MDAAGLFCVLGRKEDRSMLATLVHRLRRSLSFRRHGGNTPDITNRRLGARHRRRKTWNDDDLRLPAGDLAPVRVRHTQAGRYRW